MNDQTYEAVVERLRKVNAVIKELDPAIRSEAFVILRQYVEGKPAGPHGEGDGDGDGGERNGGQTIDTSSTEAFVRSQSTDKPRDVVAAIAAWWFSQYGAAPIKREDIEQIAENIGMTVSSRSDKTLLGMMTDGKPVFRRAARGTFVPTVPHGELFFQNEYGVSKGRKARPTPDDS